MAKSFLSVPINQIPTTTNVSDDDYIIIESPTKGTRIIRKDDLINSGGIQAGKGIIFEDSSTLGVDFENICGTGLSATEDQLMVNYGLGLSADSGGKLFVNTTQLLSGGAPSSIKYYDASGLSAIHTANVSGTVKHLYWTSNGNLSAIQLTPLSVPTIDSDGNVMLYTLTDLTIPQQIVLNATIDSLSALGGVDSAVTWHTGPTPYLNVNDNTTAIARWNSSPTYQGFLGVTLSGVSSSVKVKSRIILPAGTYFFDSGFYHATTNTDFGHAQLKLYDGSTGFPITVIASSPTIYQPYDDTYTWNLSNITPSGYFIISESQAANKCYLQLDFFGFTAYNIYTNGYGPYVTAGTLKIIKIG